LKRPDATDGRELPGVRHKPGAPRGWQDGFFNPPWKFSNQRIPIYTNQKDGLKKLSHLTVARR
jgi:hypothetical protein